MESKLEEIAKAIEQAVQYIEHFKNSHQQLIGQKAAIEWAISEAMGEASKDVSQQNTQEDVAV